MKKNNESLFSYVVKTIVDRFARIQEDRIVFTSFDGHYSDSPRYISEKLHELSPSTEIVWFLSAAHKNEAPDYVTVVDIDSKETRNYIKSAKAFVDNVYWREVYTQTDRSAIANLQKILFTMLAKHKKQYFFTTWHGTPLKRIGRDQIGNTVVDFACPKNSYMILGNRFVLDVMHRITFEKMKMELIGCPRNDLLFSDESERARIKARLGLPEDKKIVLFAPTFRSDGKDTEGKNVLRSGVNQINQMDFDKLFSTLSQKFGGEFSLICRFHYHVEQMVDFEELDKRYPGKIINGNLHDDMAEYLAVTDVLLTDASSAMFDFALTARPCFLLFPDLDHYRSRERGFYVDIDALPFSCSVDCDGLCRDILAFDAGEYQRKIAEMLCSFGYVDDDRSSERVANFILTECRK